MRKYRILYCLLILGITFCSCIDPISLDLPSSESQVFVGGWLTDQPGPYKVSVHKTNAFNELADYVPVEEAEVYVMNDEGSRFEFLLSDSSGIYISDTEFKGQVGDEYVLHVLFDGVEILSKPERMMSLSMLNRVNVVQLNDPEVVDVDSDQNNYVQGIILDELNVENFYRWKVLVNGVERITPSELVLFDDRFTDGNMFSFDADNVLFSDKDEVKIFHQSMTSSAYNYFRQLRNLTTNNAIGPNVQPSVLVGNLVDANSGDPVLGYFGVSRVTEHIVQ